MEEAVSGSHTQDSDFSAKESLPTPPAIDGDRLLYAGRDCYLIPEELHRYAGKVTTLDFSYNCISDLEGIDCFSSTLEELILDNNEMTEKTSFPKFDRLKLLSLSNNKITDLYQFIDGVEKKLPNLAYLSLIGNRACPDSLTESDCDDSDYERYRKYVIYKFPHLKFLDSKPVTLVEKKEAKRTGKYLRVVKPVTQDDQQMEQSDNFNYRPLPSDSPLKFGKKAPQAEQIFTGTFKKSKYVYHGKHSEGNRFIRNKDL